MTTISFFRQNFKLPTSVVRDAKDMSRNKSTLGFTHNTSRSIVRVGRANNCVIEGGLCKCSYNEILPRSRTLCSILPDREWNVRSAGPVYNCRKIKNVLVYSLFFSNRNSSILPEHHFTSVNHKI